MELHGHHQLQQIASTTITDTINKATATVVVTPYTVTYDGNPHTATVTSITGVNGETGATVGAVTLTSTHTNAGTYNADSYSFTPTANYSSTLSGASSSSPFTDTINKANATVIVTPYTVTYDGNPHTATVASITGVNGETGATVGTVTLTSTHTNAGTYNADSYSFTPTANYSSTLSGASSSSPFTDTINKANATVIVTPYTVTYDGNPHTASGTATGVGSVNLASDLDLTHTTHTNAATYSADYWTFTDPTGNYNNVGNTVITDQIDKAAASITVTPYNVTFDGSPHTATGSATGVLGETLSGLDLSGTTHTNAGAYTTDPWTFTDSTGNYSNSSGTVSDTINKASATILITPYSGVYDAQPHGLTGSATGVGGVNLSVGLNLGASFTDVPGGTATWIFSGGANYNDATGTAAVTISKATASINVTPYNVTYDTNPHTAAGTATGVLGVNLSAGLNLSGTTHTDAGTYNGDAWTFSGGTEYNDASGTVNDVITQEASTTSVISSASPSTFGGSVSFTATVSAANGTPGGTVQFVIDGANFGAPVALSGGSAGSGSTTTLSPGEHIVTAVYSGATDFNTSTSPFFIQTVNNPLSSIAVTPATPTIHVTDTQQFVATGTFTDGSAAILPSGGTWRLGNSITNGVRAPMAAAGSTGLLYYFGGQDSGPENFVQTYNPATGVWGSGTNMPTPRFQGVAVAGSDGLIYVIGGWNGTPTNVVEAYDPVHDTWTAKASLSHLSGCSVGGAINGLIYVLTGCDGNSGFSKEFDVYNPMTNSWSSLASPAHAHNSGAGGAIGGKFYVAGGYDVSNATDITEVYDPQTNLWTTKASMPAPLGELEGGGIMNGTLYVVGGLDDSNNAQSSVYAYNAQGDSWTTLSSSLSVGRRDIGVVALNGLLYTAGGYTGSNSNLLEILDTDDVTWASGTTTVATIGANSGLATSLTAGTSTITATSALTSVSGSTLLTVIKRDQTITFGALATKTYGDPDFSVSATASSSLAVTFIASGNCTVSPDGSVVHITAAGSCLITAQQAGNFEYNAAPDVPQTLTINRATLTASIVGNPTKPYDGNTSATLAPANFSLSGLVGSDSFTVTQTVGAYNSKDVLSASTVSASLAPGDFTPVGGTLAGNYNLPTTASGAGQITAVILTTSIIGNPTKPYDGNTNAILTPSNFSLAHLVGSESFTVTKATGAYNSKDVVTANTVTTSLTAGDFTPVGGTLASNYNLPTTASGAGQITPVTLTASIINNPTKPYDGNTNVTLTPANISLAPLVGSESFTVTQTAGTYNSKDVPTANTVTASLPSSDFTPGAGTLASNYVLPTTASGAGHITPAHLTVKADDKTKTYDGAVFSPFTSTITGFVNSETVLVVSGSASYSANATTAVNAGTYTITPSLGTLSATNYDFTTFNTGTLTINKADAHISVTPYSVTYDGNAHTATGSATGVETPTPVDLTSLLHLGATTHTNASDYPADAWTFDGNNNYNAASSTTHDHIDKANATIVVTPYSLTYDASAHTATGTAKGVVGETLAGLVLTGTTHTAANDYPTDPWTFTDVTGNYNNANNTVHDHIDKANATIVVTPYSVTYDASAHTATGTAKGVLGETLSGLDLSGSTHTSAGTYTDTWTFTDVTGNYNSTSSTIMDSINRRNATWTTNPNSKVYDAADPVPLTNGSGSNFEPTDGVTASYSRVAGETVPGSPYHITATLSSTVANALTNYVITNNGANFTINSAPTSTSLISSLNASYFGNLVTFTATVTNTSTTATPTGSLTITIGGSPVAASVTGSGNKLTATYSTNALVAGSYAIVATYANTDGDFSGSGPASLTQVVNPALTVSTVTVTPLYYNGSTTSSTNPPPAICVGSLNPCQQYSDLVTLTATVTPDAINGLTPATTVTFYVGTQNMGTVSPRTSDSGGTLTWTLPNVPLLEPSTANGQMAPGNHTVTATFGSINPNFAVVNPTTTLTIAQEDAQLTYTGLQYFSTSTTATTVDVAVSFTLQDATATGITNPIYDPNAGNITKGIVTINLTGIISGLTGGSCSALPVIAVTGQVDPTNGLPSTGTVSCVIHNVTVPGPFNLAATPAAGSYYTLVGDTNVPITTANGGVGFITGGGFQTATYLATPGATGSGKYTTAGILKPAKNSKMNFGFQTKYTKSGSTLKGGANIIIRSACITGIAGYTPVPGDDGLCVYQIKSNAISSLNENLTAPNSPNNAVFTAKANIQDVTWANPLSVAGNLTLQLSMYDVAEPGANADTLTIQVTDGSNGLWISNNWTGVQTVISATAPVIQGGNLQVH